MKEVIEGIAQETDGEPLPHEDWKEQQAQIEAEDVKSRRAARPAARTSARAATTSPTEQRWGDGNHPLSYFEGRSDESILGLAGIGPASLKEIRDAQAAQQK